MEERRGTCREKLTSSQRASSEEAEQSDASRSQRDTSNSHLVIRPAGAVIGQSVASKLTLKVRSGTRGDVLK